MNNIKIIKDEIENIKICLAVLEHELAQHEQADRKYESAGKTLIDYIEVITRGDAEPDDIQKKEALKAIEVFWGGQHG